MRNITRRVRVVPHFWKPAQVRARLRGQGQHTKGEPLDNTRVAQCHDTRGLPRDDVRQCAPLQARCIALQRAGVRRRPGLAHGICGHERVQLRGRDRGVPEQLLHHAHVGPALEQVRRERVPQRVR